MSATSSTSNFSVALRSTAVRQLWLIAIVTVCLLTLAKAIDKSVPRDAIPGWTAAELEERLSGFDLQKDVAVIGDSRVGWGIAEKLVTHELRSRGVDTTVHNLGIAAGGFRKIMERLQHLGPSSAVLVVSYTPAFLYAFDAGPLKEDRGRTRSEKWIERRINEVAQTYLPVSPSLFMDDIRKALVRPAGVIFWSSRTVYPEGFVGAVLSSSDGAPVNSAQYQFNYYSTVLHNIALHSNEANRAKQNFIATVGELRANGWRVMIIRLPIGDELLALEKAIPPQLQFEAIADALGVPFVDFTKGATTLESADGSHLTPQSARRFAPMLASEIRRLLYKP
jgi:hypothetical protein